MKKFLSMLLALIMVFGLAVPAFAGPAENIVVSSAEYYDSGALKTLTTNFKWGLGYAGATCRLVLMTTELQNEDFTNFGNYGSSFDDFEEVLSHDEANGTFGIVSYSNEIETEMGETYNITFNFKETDIPLSQDKTYFVYLWTYYTRHYYPDNLFYVINVKEGKVTYAVPDGLDYSDEDFKEIGAPNNPTNPNPDPDPDPVTHTVTFVANGEIVEVQEVEDGKDAVMPEVPAVLFNNGKWDHNGKNITSDLTITAEYALIFDVEDVVDFVTEIADDEETEEPEEEESNPNTGAPVFAPIAVLAAAAVLLKKHG